MIVAGVDRFLDKSLWTPQAFERDFGESHSSHDEGLVAIPTDYVLIKDLIVSGEEAADLVDCRIGMHLLQLPSKTFWAGFEDMSGESVSMGGGGSGREGGRRGRREDGRG